MGGDMPESLRALLERPQLTLAPMVFNGLSARLAEQAGFEALYLGGLALGYVKGAIEATLNATDFIDVGIEIRGVSALPLIIDGGGGWGDPIHVRRTVAMAEAAGFQAIELEDQLMPKRAHHHIGVEHLVPVEAMVAKIQEAVRARRSRDFLIIGRTNGAKNGGVQEALRRCDAYKKAGADVLFPIAEDPVQLRALGAAPGPLLAMVFPGRSMSDLGLPNEEMVALGYRMVVDAISPFVALYEALSLSYAALKTQRGDKIQSYAALAEANRTVDLELLLAIERRTVLA